MALPVIWSQFGAEQSLGKTHLRHTKTILHYFPQHVFSLISVKKFEKVPEVGQVNDAGKLWAEKKAN